MGEVRVRMSRSERHQLRRLAAQLQLEAPELAALSNLFASQPGPCDGHPECGGATASGPSRLLPKGAARVVFLWALVAVVVLGIFVPALTVPSNWAKLRGRTGTVGAPRAGFPLPQPPPPAR
jgi:hypothetical protein